MNPHNLLGTALAVGWWALTFWLSGKALFSVLATPAPARRAEWRMLLGVALGAGCALLPFFYSGMIGAGDSYHYALQLADFVTQLRLGVLPVLVGQSEYAFNGNVHTVRTAPYFTAVGGLLDLGTLHQLSWFALKNCLVLFTGWAAAFSAYAVVRIIAPNWRLAALLLSFLFISAPGILGPLIALDLDATFTGSPWLMLFGGAITLCCERRNIARPLAVATVALALLWYAHPPTAAWVSPALGAMLWLRLLTAGGNRGEWRNLLLVIGGFALLTAYLFRSVSSLELPYTLGSADVVRTAIILGLKEAAGFSWSIFNDLNPATFLQLGWALVAVLLVGLAPRAKMRAPEISLTFGALLILGFLFPLWRSTALLWSFVPSRLLDVTNVWPAQRFYPMLAALAVILASWKLRAWSDASRTTRTVVVGALATLAIISGVQLAGLHRHARLLKIKPAESADFLVPENTTLSRSSYLLFNHEPDNYSDGWVDPQFSSRLLDTEMSVRITNEEAALKASAETLAAAAWANLAPTARFDLDRAHFWLLVFRFTDPSARGEISLRGAVSRAYTLPLSGGAHAFGSATSAAKTLTIRAQPGGGTLLEINSTVAGVAVKVVPYSPAALPIEILGLTPYQAKVNSLLPGFLETPQVFIPGYAAEVNGQPRPVRCSLEGLVAIPIPAGSSTVTVRYPGPKGLRALWWIALGSFLAFPIVYRCLPKSDGVTLWEKHYLRENNLLRFRARMFFAPEIGIILGVAALGSGLFLVSQINARRESTKNSLRLEFELPRWTGVRSEPLLVTGRAGRADCVYMTYVDPTHLRIGFDHWGVGGGISALLPASRGQAHHLEITLGSLAEHTRDGVAALRLIYDGETAIAQAAPFWAAAPSEVFVGENPVGISTAESKFTGRLLSSERYEDTNLSARNPPKVFPGSQR